MSLSPLLFLFICPVEYKFRDRMIEPFIDDLLFTHMNGPLYNTCIKQRNVTMTILYLSSGGELMATGNILSK
jgi:hypothetical protein